MFGGGQYAIAPALRRPARFPGRRFARVPEEGRDEKFPSPRQPSAAGVNQNSPRPAAR